MALRLPLRFLRPGAPALRAFSSAASPTKVDSTLIARLQAAEQALTQQTTPVADGPTALAQSHLAQPLTSALLHDITQAERALTGATGPVASGPASVAMSWAQRQAQGRNPALETEAAAQPSGVLDAATISRVTAAEKPLTGHDGPVPGGPTAQAQRHAGEPLQGEAVADISQGERKITGLDAPVQGGPAATVQSDATKARD